MIWIKRISQWFEFQINFSPKFDSVLCHRQIINKFLAFVTKKKKIDTPRTNLPKTAAAKSLPSCRTLCDPIDGSPPGSAVPGILQARTLEWVAISFSNAWKWKVKVKLLSPVRLWVTPWTAAYQAPPSMGFSRQKYWSRVPVPSPKTRCSKKYICPSILNLKSFYFLRPKTYWTWHINGFKFKSK